MGPVAFLLSLLMQIRNTSIGTDIFGVGDTMWTQ